MYPFFKKAGGFTPSPATPPGIRVVLLHTERFVQSLNSPTVCSDTIFLDSARA